MVKLTRNKMITELVLSGHTLADVAKAFNISGPNVRKVTQETVAKALHYDILDDPHEISIKQCRLHSFGITENVRSLSADTYKACKCPGSTDIYFRENREIV